MTDVERIADLERRANESAMRLADLDEAVDALIDTLEALLGIVYVEEHPSRPDLRVVK